MVRLEREERLRPVGTLIRGGKSFQRERCARARTAKGRYGLGGDAHRGGAGHVCGYGVLRTKRRYLEGGLKRALEEDPGRPGHPTKLDEPRQAHLIALACRGPSRP